jgi:hypothetical protein
MSIQQRELAPGHILTSGTRNTGKEWIGVAGATITAFDIVCVNGTQDAHIQVVRGDQAAAATRSSPLFIAMHGANNGDQVRLTEMVVESPANVGAAAVNDPVYLGATGSWTVTAPTNTVIVGRVITAGATGAVLLFGKR